MCRAGERAEPNRAENENYILKDYLRTRVGVDISRRHVPGHLAGDWTIRKSSIDNRLVKVTVRELLADDT